MEHDLEGIPFDQHIAENKCGGRDFCVCVCAKVLNEARVEKKKKKNSWKIERKKEKLWKEWRRVEKYVWKALKCWLLKKGSKKLEFDPKCCMNFPFVFKVDFLHSKVNSKCQNHYFAHYCFKNVCLPLPFFVSQYP